MLFQDLLHKCTSTPALSSPHSEISHQPLGCNISFSPSRVEDGKQGTAVGFDLQELSQNSNDHGCEEKGHQDSFEKEVPSAVDHSDVSVLDSYRSPQVRDDSPQSPGLDSVKSPVSCPQEATSWAAQIINGTEGSDTRYGVKHGLSRFKVLWLWWGGGGGGGGGTGICRLHLKRSTEKAEVEFDNVPWKGR